MKRLCGVSSGEDDMNTRRAHILFPDHWLPYSPTVLNFFSLLERSGFGCHLYTFDNGEFFKRQTSIPEHWHILRVHSIFYKILQRSKLLGIFKISYFIAQLVFRFKKGDRVVGVDPIGLLAAMAFTKDPIFLSLEVRKNIYFRLASFFGFKNVIIQTKERAEYLFPEGDKRVFFLQNAPINSGKWRKRAVSLVPLKLLYFGNIIEEHGIEMIIDAVLNLPAHIELHLVGPVQEEYLFYLCEKYNGYIGKRISISEEYIPQEAVVDFVSKFDVGLVFYDFSLIAQNDFNYLSSPSGKLFNYFAAGLPVIGSDILGFKAVRDFNAGILLNPESLDGLSNAITKIEKNYESYSANSERAGVEFDFKRNFDYIFKVLFKDA